MLEVSGYGRVSFQTPYTDSPDIADEMCQLAFVYDTLRVLFGGNPTDMQRYRSERRENLTSHHGSVTSSHSKAFRCVSPHRF